MRAPSEKKLVEAFRDLDKKGAKLIRAFAKAEDDPEKLEELVDSGKVPATEAYVRSLYSSPYRSGIWRVTVALHAINEIVGGYGVEGLGPGDQDVGYAPPYEYINFGDPYVATLIYDREKDRLYIGDWGTIQEEEGESWGDEYVNPRPKKKSRRKKKTTRRVHKAKVGDEVLVRTATGDLHDLVVVRSDARGVELAHNRHSLPIWGLTHAGLKKAMARVNPSKKKKKTTRRKAKKNSGKRVSNVRSLVAKALK